MEVGMHFHRIDSLCGDPAEGDMVIVTISNGKVQMVEFTRQKKEAKS